jgi:hypothetical protein
MKQYISQYIIEEKKSIIRIIYTRSLKDYFYIVIYGLLSILIFNYTYFLFLDLFQRELTLNIGIGIGYSLIITFLGIYFFIVSLETLTKPNGLVFEINKEHKSLTVKINQLKKIKFDFNQLKKLKLKNENIKVENRVGTTTFKRNLNLIFMNLELSNNDIYKIHVFENPELLRILTNRKNKENLRQTSRQITKVIAEGCGISFN